MKINKTLRLLFLALLVMFCANTGCYRFNRPDSDRRPPGAGDKSEVVQDTTASVRSTPAPQPAPTASVSPAAAGGEAGETVLTLSFVGDIMLDSHVKQLLDQKGVDFMTSEIKPLFSQSDFVMANLENPLSSRGTPEADKQYTFRGKPEHADVLAKAGIDVVSLANNHILDFGVEALEDTLQLLSAKGVRYAGAGPDMDAAAAPVYLSVKGQTFAVLASSHVIPSTSWAAGIKKPGVATTYDPARLRSEISKARKKADIVIVYVHWGEESKRQPLAYQKNLARLYIDDGADIVVGAHPHELQGIEFYKEKVIAYSLGNFIFTNTKKDTAVLQLQTAGKKIREVRWVPCEIVNFRPVVVTDSARIKSMLQDMGTLSPHVVIDAEGVIQPKKQELP